MYYSFSDDNNTIDIEFAWNKTWKNNQFESFNDFKCVSDDLWNDKCF